MKRWIGKTWMWAVAMGTALTYVAIPGRAESEAQKLRNMETLAEVLGVLQKKTVEPPQGKRLAHATIQGMLRTLDPHSSFMDEEEFRLMREEQKGSFYGIGAIIQQQDEGVVIVSPIKGGPAERLGIRAGDIIREIDNQSTETWSRNQVLNRLRGEKGTLVEVAVQRSGVPDYLRYTITRAEIPTNTVDFAFMFTPETGYIHVKDFGETTSEEFERSVEKLRKLGMKNLILDLRLNPGGLLDAAVGICRQLLGPDQIIVSTKGREGKEEHVVRTPKGAAGDSFPLVILIDRASASASEIVAGAIQDHDRGLVVGQGSWGKGLVQTVMTIGRSRGLALTTARYYTPSGRCIQRDYSHGLDEYLYPTEPGKDETPEAKGSTYKTGLGRTVYGGGGITPDIKIESEKLSSLLYNLLRQSAFFKFAIHEKESHSIPANQRAGEAELARFKTWLLENKISFQESEWTTHVEAIRNYLSFELHNAHHSFDAGQRMRLEADPVAQKALEVMPEAAALLQKSQLQRRLRTGDVVAHVL